jgi:prepilin-type N-terminal cleavage/methylation domain-containing protein
MKRPEGFTLVEILIVVVLLAIIAAVVLPQFTNASVKARESMLADDLRLIRTQIIVWKSQHRGVSPGYPGGDVGATPTEGAFVAHVTQSSNEAGVTAFKGTPGYRYGPYMSQIPENPINGKNSVLVLADGAELPDVPTDTCGWIYHPSTLTFRADCSGNDESGKPYYDY